MSEWIDLVVYAMLIVAVWGWLSTWTARVAVLLVADRNPNWLAAHPEVGRKLAGNRWFRWSCWLWGSLSLATLVAFQVGLWPRSLAIFRDTRPWEALKDLNSALFIAGLAYVGGCSLLFSQWLCAKVPLAQRRQATLEPRSIDDHVPREFQYAVYSVIVLHLAAWIAAGVTGQYATGAFWGAMAFQFVISGVFVWFVARAVQRRPAAVDRIFGTRYRQTEVRLAFAAQLLPLMNGTARLYEQVTDTRSQDIDRVLHLGVVVFVVAMVITLAARFRKNHAMGHTRWPGAPVSAGVLGVVAFLATTAVSAQGSAPATLNDDEIRAVLAERVDKYRHGVGVVVGIVDANDRRVITYGRRATDQSAQVEGDTVFELASITKAFTSLLLADAVTRGDVALTDPVAKHLPPSVRMPERGGRSITLHDLATHTSGLAREPSNLQPKDPSNPFADYSVEQLYQFLSGHQLTRDIGTEFDYSNLGAGLLGHVLARPAGTDYETLVRTRVTDRLGMSSTATALSPSMRAHLCPRTQPLS